jgi:hypothetical protein
MGGLGNQLFQIFTVISYAIKYKHMIKFINAEILGTGKKTKRKTYWNDFLFRLSGFLMDEYPHFDIIYKEEKFSFEEIPQGYLKETRNTNILLHGYFQSYKYFHKNYYLIIRMLNIAEVRLDVLEEVLKNYHTNEFLKNCISMHFRLGDYKKLSEYHPIMSTEYYKKSLEHIIEKLDYTPNVLYFCEDQDIEDVNKTIQLLKNDFPTVEFERASNQLDDWKQMLLMSCCNHNIIANSSFSWWGAYLNENTKKIVCYPSNWFGPKMENTDTTDLFLPEWNKI